MSTIKHQKPSQSSSLRSTFKTLKAYTSKLANFTLQWQDLEDHFLSIKTQLQQLEKTYKTNTQEPPFLSQNTNPQSQNEDNTTKKFSFQSENENPEAKIKDDTAELSIEPQNKILESKNDDNTTKPSATPPIPVESGKSLLLYLNKHVKELDLLQSDVYEALKNISNPGKLVLQALRFFYPSDSSKGDMDVGVSVIRKSCVILLEQLIKVGPLVGSQEREEAMRMALEWKGKMPVNIRNSLEVLGFLMIVGAFGLVGKFDKDEMLRLVGNVAKRKQAPELFRAFGFANEVHDFIQNLIKQKKRLEAVQFIYAFELVDKFPPVPLLREHSKYAEEISKIICSKGHNSFKARDNARNSQIAALRGIIKLIKKYKLQSEYSPVIIRNEIRELRKMRNDKRADENTPDSTPDLMVQPEQQIGNKRTAPSESQPNQHNTDKRLRTAVPTAAFPDASINATATIHSKQPSQYRIGAVHYMIPSTRKAAPATDVTSVCVSAASTIHSMQSSHLHPTLLLSGSPLLTQHMDMVAGPYQSGGCASANHHLSSTAGQYSLMGATSVRPHMSSSVWQYGANAVRNGDIGQLGLAGSPRPVGIISNVSSYKSVPYYSGEAGRRPGYFDRSDGANFGVLPQRPPSIYHL